ncbi:MAG: nucleoside phosphorylase [Thaumarchaeota archaeon]|nr:nucleoside phosphorylase [Nitrososphaerota archaeon]
MPRAMKQEPAIFSPNDFIAYLAERNNLTLAELSVPSRLLATYHRGMFETVRRRIRGRYSKHYYPKRLAIGEYRGIPVGVIQSFIGGSASVMMLEEMIASGARMILEVGICGGLDPSLTAGDFVVVDEAFVDEGTTLHYRPTASPVAPSRRTTSFLTDFLRKKGFEFAVGGVWTTDAPYRETRAKVRRFRGRGALGVNMESSAVFTVAKHRGVEIASLQVVSDLLGLKKWVPKFHEKRVRDRTVLASRVAVEAVVAMKPKENG